MISHCPSFVVGRAMSTIALKANSYTSGPVDSKVGRKHWGDEDQK